MASTSSTKVGVPKSAATLVRSTPPTRSTPPSRLALHGHRSGRSSGVGQVRVPTLAVSLTESHPLGGAHAEEAEADTFYKLWRGAHLPADETHRRRLVVRTARQCAIDRYRALLRRGETLPLDDRDDAELAVALESELETRELMAQIMALPPHDGELFLRRYVYGETAAQLGVHFNMPAATVRTRLHRARLALQKLLKEG